MQLFPLALVGLMLLAASATADPSLNANCCDGQFELGDVPALTYDDEPSCRHRGMGPTSGGSHFPAPWWEEPPTDSRNAFEFDESAAPGAPCVVHPGLEIPSWDDELDIVERFVASPCLATHPDDDADTEPCLA